MSEVVLWGDKKRLQTQVVEEVAADTLAIRSLDWDRDRFDIEFGWAEARHHACSVSAPAVTSLTQLHTLVPLVLNTTNSNRCVQVAEWDNIQLVSHFWRQGGPR